MRAAYLRAVISLYAVAGFIFGRKSRPQPGQSLRPRTWVLVVIPVTFLMVGAVVAVVFNLVLAIFSGLGIDVHAGRASLCRAVNGFGHLSAHSPQFDWCP